MNPSPALLSPSPLPAPIAAPPLPRRGPAPLLLPASVLRPWVIVAVGVIPQAILLLINLQAWDLAAGEASSPERQAALVIFILELLSLLVPVGLAARLWATRRSFSRLQGALSLVVGPLFLAAALTLSSDAIPEALADWMLPRDQWILKQFALAVPMVLFGALRLLCPDREDRFSTIGGWANPILVAAGLVGASVGYLFCAALMGSAFRGLGSAHLADILVVAGYIGLSLLAAAGVMRVCIGLYLWVRGRSVWGLGILSFFVALAGPIAGLALNASIPFPSDFQLPSIYVLAVLNGVVVLLPNFASIFWQRVTWLLQCLFFPFTVYFFAVFVPVFALAPLGMLFFGLGFLIYVPGLLFLLHGYRILDGCRLAVRDGKRLAAIAAGSLAILAWPVGYTVSARLDRANLLGALDYLQYPNYGENAGFPGRLGPLRSALHHLRDFKEGHYLPYLSEYYNRLAFDNLVLPQSRLNATYEAFFGEPLPKPTAQSAMEMFSSRRPRNVTETLNEPAGERPTANGILRKCEVKTSTSAGVSRSRVSLSLHNPTSVVTEYATRIEVPPGVLVSGLSLTIGRDNVAGRLFERRAALWVYQKITETRPVPKDPAILRFVGPNVAELRVYPLAAGEERHVEVELLYPEGWGSGIRIGSNPLAVAEAPAPAPLIATSPDGLFSVLLPGSTTRELPAQMREPYLHFLVDTSKDSAFQDERKLKDAMAAVAKTFPAIKSARISFVNFETRSFQDGRLVGIGELENIPAGILRQAAGSFRGGFLPGRGIKEVLWQHNQDMDAEKGSALRSCPRIVVLNGTAGDGLPDPLPNLPEFAGLLPDLPGYWTLRLNSNAPAFSGLNGSPQEPAQKAVNIFQTGKARFASAAGEAVSYSSIRPGPGRSGEIKVFQPETGTFAALLPAKPAAAAPEFSAALVPWNLELARVFEPSRNEGNEPLKRLLKISRETGTLVPSLAYMVVENTAQWKMLERTEKKTLNGHEALSLSENAATPEPGVVALLILGFCVLLGKVLGPAFLARGHAGTLRKM